MLTKHVCVCIHIRNKDEVGAVKHVQALQWFLQTFLLFMFHVCLYYIVLSVPSNLVIACWEM